MNQELFASVDAYICNLFSLDDAALQATNRSIEENNIPPISVSAPQGKLLNVLAHVCNAKKILEVGTLAGYSTIWMARALPPDGKLITLEYEPLHADVAHKNLVNAGLDHLVEIRIGKALELLPGISHEGLAPFDMIFIDADKEPYLEYFEWALKLSRPGTLIIADNVIREGKVLEENHPDSRVVGVQRFNKFLAACDAVHASIIQTVGAKEHDGMAIAVVK